MMGTDPFLWIGIWIADPYPSPDPDYDSPFFTRSIADPVPDPLFLTRSRSRSESDRRSRIAILPITEYITCNILHTYKYVYFEILI